MNVPNLFLRVSTKYKISQKSILKNQYYFLPFQGRKYCVIAWKIRSRDFVYVRVFVSFLENGLTESYQIFTVAN